MFRWHQSLPAVPYAGPGEISWGVQWAVTDRYGGVSQDSFSELNLGAGTRDKADSVASNRSLLAAEFGVAPNDLRFMRQQHGEELVHVRAGSSANPECDALITDDPAVALAVLVADCTPVLLVDRVAGWAGALHAGRAGMTRGLVTTCVQALRELGAHHLQAVVGPSICGRCYEVPEQMRALASVTTGAAHTTSWSGTPAIDVAAGVAQQLHEAGVPMTWLPGCTRESDDLYSHRRDPHTGRFAAVVKLIPAEGG